MKNERIRIYPETGKSVFDIRKSKRVTQEELAELADVEVNTIKRIERTRNGDQYITSMSTLARIAVSLAVDIKDLLGDCYLKNIEKWTSYCDRWKLIVNSDEPWMTYEGSGWEDRLDRMILTCNKYPVEELIVMICAEGGEGLIMDGLERYKKLSEKQN